MIVHNVYFWLKDEVTEGQKNEFKAGTKKFLSAVDEVQKFEIGEPAATPPRDVVDHSFAVSIFVWFDNVEDHNTYQTHAAHDVFIDSFKDLWAEVQVVDSQII